MKELIIIGRGKTNILIRERRDLQHIGHTEASSGVESVWICCFLASEDHYGLKDIGAVIGNGKSYPIYFKEPWAAFLRDFFTSLFMSEKNVSGMNLCYTETVT